MHEVHQLDVLGRVVLAVLEPVLSHLVSLGVPAIAHGIHGLFEAQILGSGRHVAGHLLHQRPERDQGKALLHCVRGQV